MGTPRAREGAWDPREHPGKCPALAPMAPVASPGSCRGAWSRSPGPRFSAGECLLRTPRTTGRGSLHGEGGVRALWDPGRIAHGPFSQSSAQTLESRSVSVQVYRLGAGWGRLSRERLLAHQAGLRPKTPPRDPVPGRGSGLPGTPPHRPPAPPPAWPGTVAGPSSRPQVPSSSPALCLRRGGRRAGKCGPREKDRTSGWRGELPVPRDTTPGTL